MKTKVAFVGGFLGAGKTTLLWEAANRLTKQGKRVGLITNDQAPELVDTALLDTAGVGVEEVSGSCFCCNFDGLIKAIGTLKATGAEMILAEPVGSCTDLSATLMQPIKQHYRDELALKPLSVILDPDKLPLVLGARESGLHGSAVYIIQKQLEEADIILLNKTDLMPAEDVARMAARCAVQWPLAQVLPVSAKTGAGLDTWLERLSGAGVGARIAAVDYDVYAEGEAVLGWLNLKAALTSDKPDWNAYAAKLLSALGRRLDAMDLPVGHVKLVVRSGGRRVAGNITGQSATLDIRGAAGAEREAELILNARMQTSPEALQRIVLQELENADGSVGIRLETINCLSPGRPNPTHRYGSVVR